MMSTERAAEAEILSFTVRQFEDDGYSVIIEPAPSVLPAALRDARPDAIAIGKRPSFAIEVVREGTKYAGHVARLQSALAELPDWKLYLVLDRSILPETVPEAPRDDIQQALESLARVAEVDTRAALLLGWGCFEAISRRLEPEKFQKPQSPGRIVETLASLAYILPSEATAFRELVSVRNAVVHGNLAPRPTKSEIKRFQRMLTKLWRSSAMKASGR